MHALYLSKSGATGATDPDGLQLLTLTLLADGVAQDHILIRSGAPGHQAFRTATESRMGSYEPIPEGYYLLGDHDADRGLNWASGRWGDYSGNWGPGLGPVWCGVHPDGLRGFSRESIGIHLDANASWAPGTAGCIGVRTLEDLKRWVSWHNRDDWPQRLVVDYGLGTVSRPAAPDGELHRLKVFAGERGGHWSQAMLHDGDEQQATSLRLDAHDGRMGVAVVGEQVEPVSVRVEVVYRRRP